MRITVYHGQTAVGRVTYNSNLDFWDGHNWTSGSTGRHLGLTKLKKPVDDLSFVLIHGTQWEGERDYAELISDRDALQHILRAGNEDLLKKYFPDHSADLEEE